MLRRGVPSNSEVNHLGDRSQNPEPPLTEWGVETSRRGMRQSTPLKGWNKVLGAFRKVIADPGPLFIQGPRGVGTSALARGCVSEKKSQGPDGEKLFVSLEDGCVVELREEAAALLGLRERRDPSACVRAQAATQGVESTATPKKGVAVSGAVRKGCVARLSRSGGSINRIPQSSQAAEPLRICP